MGTRSGLPSPDPLLSEVQNLPGRADRPWPTAQALVDRRAAGGREMARGRDAEKNGLRCNHVGDRQGPLGTVVATF